MYDELVNALRRLSDWSIMDFEDNLSYANQIAEEAADAIEVLSKMETTTPRWISVEERLPLYGQDVLAVRTYGDGEKCQEVLMAHIAVWNEGTGRKWWNATNITHWMPLPEPPKEET